MEDVKVELYITIEPMYIVVKIDTEISTEIQLGNYYNTSFLVFMKQIYELCNTL